MHHTTTRKGRNSLYKAFMSARMKRYIISRGVEVKPSNT